FVGNMSKWWFETYPTTEPLFLQVGFPGPHPPFDPPARYTEPYLKRNDLQEERLGCRIGIDPPFGHVADERV
ncbi:hypothetical protein ACC674_38385, partial [Rhizobium ruizarguesonis]